jgi:hypothetical protein
LLQDFIDRRQQSLAIERLAEKSIDPLGTFLVGNLVAARNEKYWEVRARFPHLVAEPEPVHSWHSDIRDEHVHV